MLHRLLSSLLVLTLLCAEIPAIFPQFFARAEMEIAMDETYAEVEAKTGYRTLVRGDRDSEDSAYIVLLQNKLIELGYLRDAADGVFGENTEIALKTFQRSNNLEPTGQADAVLQRMLYSGAELVSAETSTDPESVAYRVQDRLAQWGFMVADPDGLIGSRTTEAVAAFKEYLRARYWDAYPTPAPAMTPAPDMNTSGYGDAAIAIDMPLKQSNDGDITEEVLAYVNGEYTFNPYLEDVSNGDDGYEAWRVQRRLSQLNYLAVADGVFGDASELALKYFQKKHGLEETGIADEATQRALFAADAKEAEEYVNEYKLVVDISEQMVYAYQWNGSNYGICVREMICSTGKNDTPTPEGSYQAAGPTGTGEWYWFSEYECYAKWATRIVGGILFHSVTYSRGKNLNRASVRNLGRKASHGCVRLKVEDAEWVYGICDLGTTVTIQQ